MVFAPASQSSLCRPLPPVGKARPANTRGRPANRRGRPADRHRRPSDRRGAAPPFVVRLSNQTNGECPQMSHNVPAKEKPPERGAAAPSRQWEVLGGNERGTKISAPVEIHAWAPAPSQRPIPVRPEPVLSPSKGEIEGHPRASPSKWVILEQNGTVSEKIPTPPQGHVCARGSTWLANG